MNKSLIKAFTAVSLSLSVVSTVIADDTDIIDVDFYGGSNILFVMDMSGSMNYGLNAEVVPANPANSRVSILTNALQTVLNDPMLTDINIGITSFSGMDSNGNNSSRSAHGITYPVSPIDSDASVALAGNSLFTHNNVNSFLPNTTVGSPPVSFTTRGYISSLVPTTWNPDNGTPIVDALYEAALYFRGMNVVAGAFAPTNIRSAHPSTYSGTPISATGGNVTYNSPITHACSNNAIVLLSDGRPTANATATAVQNMIGGSCSVGTNRGRCGAALTRFLATTDLVPNTTLAGNQLVRTHVIGVGLNLATANGRAANTYLSSIANNGNGIFANATTAAGLATALSTAIEHVTKARSFVAPTYTPNLSSLLSHSDDVYLPVFDRGLGPVWPGNLRKFKINNGKLVDADGLDALDANGALKETARDFWSSDPSVHSIKSGGVAYKIDPANRNLVTDNGLSFVNISNASLTDLNATDTAEKTRLINYIRGFLSDGTERHHMGDIIHSKPIHIAYGSSSSPQKVLFFGTNEGFLHAVNDNDGTEIFTYMPKELLGGIKTQYLNDAATDHLYGVDGPITLQHLDSDKDGIINNGEKAVIYFGLRRGGRSYYAIDISKRTSPKLLWKIDNSKSGFTDLGFSWSQPVITKLNHRGTLKDVLVFGGGYIDDHGTGTNSIDGNGNIAGEVYIVDASNGSLIWKTSNTPYPQSVNYAKPARIRVLDVNNNGSLDRLYYGDTGGNIWRVDFEDEYSSSTDAKVMLFAQLGNVSAPATSKRKFFNEPDVALFKHQGKFLMSIAIGSGDRPNPLDVDNDDHFFMLFDEFPFQKPPSSTPVITLSKLANATSGPVSNALSGTNKGWYMDFVMVNGEKSLSDALTYNNMVMFNTLGATEISVNVCGRSSKTHPRLYVVDLLTGGAALDLDKDGTISPGSVDDRAIQLPPGDIPGTPQIIFNTPRKESGGPCERGDCVRPETITSGGKSIGGNGTGIVLPAPNKSLRKVYWLDKEQQ